MRLLHTRSTKLWRYTEEGKKNREEIIPSLNHYYIGTIWSSWKAKEDMMLFKVSAWELLDHIFGKNWGDSLGAITSPPCLTVYKYNRPLVSVRLGGRHHVFSTGDLEDCFTRCPDLFWRHLCPCRTYWGRKGFLATEAQQSLQWSSSSWCFNNCLHVYFRIGLTESIENQIYWPVLDF